MGNSQSNSRRLGTTRQSKPSSADTVSSDLRNRNLQFLQIDPNASPAQHAQTIRRRHSSISNLHHTPSRPLRHRRSTSSVLFSRLSLGCTSAAISVSSSIDSDPSELFDSTPPTSPSITTFSKQSQPVAPSLPPSHLAYYSPTVDGYKLPGDSAAESAFDAFLKQFPQYRLTWILDTLRRTDYTRLSRISRSHSHRSADTETYVDYMGGSLYPESLIRVHTEFLASNVLGNTHSISASSQLSLRQAEEARASVLDFFGAPLPNQESEDDSNEYTVIFTPNASGALKLVGEAYQFSNDSSFVLSTDSHNSVNGIREFARRGGAKVVYVPSGKKGHKGAFELNEAKSILKRNQPPQGTGSLFALTGLSNITNAKCPALYSSPNSESIITYARSLGYHTLLDAAALAPSTKISLVQIPVDALAVSFYKMFGFPTGVGALVIRKGFLRKLKSGRPWFAGGTVDVVQVPGQVRTMKGVGEEFEGFEDGTINYLLLPAITSGLHLLSAYLPFLPLRLNCLIHYLVSELGRIRHRDKQGRIMQKETLWGWQDLPVCQVLSRVPKKVLKVVGETDEETGAVVSCVFLDVSGDALPLSFIAHSAAHEGISLRTGCMCNPGGAAALLDIEDKMKDVQDGGMMREGMTLKEFEEDVERERRRIGLASVLTRESADSKGLDGRMELGVVRISLGLGTDWGDVWRVLQWARRVGDERERRAMWRSWKGEGEVERPEDDWRQMDDGAVIRPGAASCKGADNDVHCVSRLSLVDEKEGWETMIGTAI